MRIEPRWAAIAIVACFASSPYAQDRPAGAEGTSPASQVLSKVHQSNQFEMRAAELAMENAEHERVRRYAERLFRDHRNANQMVLALAEREGISLEAPEPATPEDKQQMQQREKLMQQLQQAQGESLDRVYLNGMVSVHEKAIGMLTKALETKLEDPDVTELISNLIPILEQHLNLAEELQEDLVTT